MPAHDAQPVAVIGDHQKIERTRQLRLDSGGRGYFLPASEFQRVFRAETNAEAEGVNRIIGMQMGIAPQHGFRIFGEGNRRFCIGNFSGVSRCRGGKTSRRQRPRLPLPHQPMQLPCLCPSCPSLCRRFSACDAQRAAQMGCRSILIAARPRLYQAALAAINPCVRRWRCLYFRSAPSSGSAR